MSSTNFMVQTEDALYQHLMTFTSTLPVTIRWATSLSVPLFGQFYIDPVVDVTAKRTQDMGSQITSRIDGRLILGLSVPELEGEAKLVQLADELSEHFFPGAVPIAYSYDSLPDTQAAHVIKSPSLEGQLRREGGYVKQNLVVHFMTQPQRNL